MMKLRSTIILFILLISTGLVAQDLFVRGGVINPPDTYPSGFGATISGVDLDGDGKLEIYSVNGMTDFMTGDEIPQIIKYERSGTAWDSVWAASFPNERQNTWAALTVGDLDGDGKQEIIWGFVNSFATNTTPPRIVVFEANGDDILGISDGAGNYTPNTSWNMDIPESVNMRPLKWEAFDIDGDGKEEVIFAERRDHFNLGIVSVSDVPDGGTGSEIWTMEFNKNTELYNQFVRSNVIESPDGGFGGIVTGMDYDNDGLMDLYAVNNNWSDGTNGELIPTIFKYELVAGAWVLKWSTSIPGMDFQNTWPVLTAGDWDGDGKGEIQWCPPNNLDPGNEDPTRIVVYETPGDGTDAMGVDNGDGTWKPNAAWNMNVPASTEMRPFRGYLTDIDNDGALEFVFAERRNFYDWGVVGVSDIPDNADGSEVWTLEAAGANLLSGMNLNITFEDDSDIVNWSHHDETNLWTSESHNPTAGVDGSGALELGDAGYGFLAKRPVVAKAGATFNLSVDIHTLGWGDTTAYPLYLIVEGFTNPDTVVVNSDTAFTTFTLSGTATGNAGYIKVAGENTLGANNVWVDNVVFTLNDGSSRAPSSEWRDLAIIDQTMYLFEGNDNEIRKITNDGTNYTVSDPFSINSVWSWLSANTVDIDGDGTEEIVTGDYLSGGSAGVWVFVPDADTLIGHKIADFAGNAANRVTGVRAGYINADSLLDFTVGFRGTDEIYLVAYQGGDITSAGSYVVSLLDKGVLNADGTGQMDMVTVANIDGIGMDEVLYTGVPRGVASNKSPLTVGSYSDTLKADAGRRWDMVVANGAAHFFTVGGGIQSVYHDGSGYKLTKTQPGIVNGTFLSASAADVEGDGIDEIIVSNWRDAKVNMLKWINGAWVAYEIADLTALGGSRLNGGSVGDIDGDGHIDFVTGSRASVPNGQIYRVEYTGGDVMDAASWSGTVIESGMNDLFSQYEVINIANLDDDADLEVLYTSDYARGPNTSADAPFPIVILDLQKVDTETIANVKVDADADGIPDRKGEQVVTMGIVTSLNFSGSSYLATIQDENAAIHLWSSGDTTSNYSIGDRIQVTGEVSQFRGLTQISTADSLILFLGAATPPTPLVVSIHDLQEDPEKYESMLLQINAIALASGTWPAAGSNANLKVTDGYLETAVRIDKDLDISGQPEPVWPVNMVVVAGQYTSSSSVYNDGYQYFPRMYSDIEQNVAAPPSPYFFFTDETESTFDDKTIQITAHDQELSFVWSPAVDLNGDALIYQMQMLLEDGSSVEFNAADTFVVITGQQVIAALNNTNQTVDITLRTKGSEPALVSSVDTLEVTFDIIVSVDGGDLIPKEFFVDQNYPNPFNPTTTIQFGLPVEAEVNLIIYDILGREVVRLVNNQIMSAGVHQYTFDASKLASGTYIYRLQADKKVEVKKMLLLK